MNSQLTQLKETGIYILELPISATDIQLHKQGATDDLCITYYIEGVGIAQIAYPGKSGDWQLLGTITSDLISFDPAPYFQNEYGFYRDYRTIDLYPFDNPTESFRSLLTICSIEVANKLHLALIKK